MLPWTMGHSRARPDVRDIVMIAGEDPYAWRGIEELSKPWVRPDNAERQREILAKLGGGTGGAATRGLGPGHESSDA